MTLTCLKLSCSLSLCRIGTLLVVHTPRPCPADVPLAGEGGLAADCIDLRWQQTCANARFVYVHVGVVLAAAHSIAALFTRAGTSAAVWEFATRTATVPCFPAVLCADKKVCVAAEAAGGSWPGKGVSLLIHTWIQGPSWVDLQEAGGRDAQGSADCSDRALLGSPLKQQHYFRDMFKGKFPVSTVCERVGLSEGGICHLWVMLWMFLLHTEVRLQASAHPALPPAAVGLQRQLPRLPF